MKNLILSLLVLVLPLQASAACQGSETYCDILKLKPSVDKVFAKALAKSINRYAAKFGVSPKYSVAIAMQESSFSNVNRPGVVLTKTNVFVQGHTDLGVFQLHVLTLGELLDKGYALDVKRLRTDVDYQTSWHMRILKKKIQICKAQREKLGVRIGEEWSCYHSFTPRQRQVYVDMVGNHLNKIMPKVESEDQLD